MPERKPIKEIVALKERGARITMLTAYDYPTALWVDRAGVDLVLVGDSLANVALGLESTVQVGMEVMLHHAKAVGRAVKMALIVADMPFEAYQVDRPNAAFNARRFIMEAGCHAVKVEWFDDCPAVVRDLRKSGIAVMGHVGLTPQTATDFHVKGKDIESATRILNQARQLEEAGCFAVVLECVPEALAADITRALKVPTIGIGAGKYCDGQVLVLADMLGLNERKLPKFVKKYEDLGARIVEAVRLFKEEVASGQYPDSAHTFH